MCWFVFFKQKTAYERRISDWSSDVCSSDLSDRRPDRAGSRAVAERPRHREGIGRRSGRPPPGLGGGPARLFACLPRPGADGDGAERPAEPGSGTRRRARKSVVQGKRVSVRVGLGGGRIIKKKNTNNK